MSVRCNKFNHLDKVAHQVLKQLLSEEKGVWTVPNAKYREYKRLSIDKRGSFGERLFAKTINFRRLQYNDGDQGLWDLKIDGLKLEVKTASLDKQNKFQNEGLKKESGYDGILFLGVAPDQLYVKMVRREDIPWSKLHNRGAAATGCGYKWDLRCHDMVKVTSPKAINDEFQRVFYPEDE